jgi:hypothetical protein
MSGCAGAPAPLGPPHTPVSIPFEQGPEGHILLPVTVDGVEGWAVLDNGAYATVVDRKFAEERGLTKDPVSALFVRVWRRGFDHGKDTRVHVGGVVETVEPVLLDLASWERESGEPAIAFVGEEFFERHVVEVDFTRKLVTLHDRRTFVPPGDLQTIPLTSSPTTGKVTFPATVEGVSGHQAVIDLGGSGFAGIVKGPMADRLLADGRPSIPTSASGYRNGVRRSFGCRTLWFRVLEFGGFRLNDVPLDACDDDGKSPPKGAVWLNISVLSRFDSIFDVAGQKIWLRPNAAYAEPFPHRLIGNIVMGPGPTPGTLRVTDVESGSPAGKAGLKAGDVIVKFGGVEPTLANMEALETQEEPKLGDVLEIQLDDGRTIRIVAERFY